MARRKKQEISFAERLLKIKRAGIDNYKPPNVKLHSGEEVDNLETRIEKVLGIFNHAKNKPNTMIYFVMYDIENDKIRNHIAKFLIRKGCVRVQKSIFLAESERKLFNEIHQTLKEVQEVYDNFDSIFMVPVSTDEIRAMKVIGESIDYDLVLGNKNTLFF